VQEKISDQVPEHLLERVSLGDEALADLIGITLLGMGREQPVPHSLAGGSSRPFSRACMEQMRAGVARKGMLDDCKLLVSKGDLNA